MKAALENIETLKGKDSFVAYGFTVPFFQFKWHYHPEYELTLITKGHGKRVVGDSHENFSTGDLVLIGPELPHTWSNESFGAGESSAIVIQFSQEFIDKFSTLNECAAILQVLQRSNCGSFFPTAHFEIANAIKMLPHKKGLDRIVALLDILEALSGEASQPLSSGVYSASRSSESAHRINKVCRFIQEKSAGNISLEQAASLVSLSKSAFCKFFKRMMKTGFSDYVNEIRIANACLLLTDSDKTVREIAADSGFESLTYFNRIFLRKKGKTPVAFRKSGA
ncbi:MAG: AraC family transcriptional regulator [Flavobacterium sp.]|uniref:AraC family transcriptional regulator n=1 Tax=Flavobacterium sp. TaxID=239 RepID=UPI00122B66AF|nr:AraC family transcriptional regulator [Flavobacterium sp.]RZJ67051.1 MAG: AraC family transcriptional regulator [Flavobacterium sp.]